MKTCAECQRTTTKTSRGLCTTCYSRRRRSGLPLPPAQKIRIPNARVAEILEDTAWLADTGVGLTEAAHRLDTTPEALDRLLQRRGRHDLLEPLRTHDLVPDACLHGLRETTTPFTPRGPVRGHWKVA